ncbi:hypothetical protein ZOSMA_80G00240 [Zostera marina]|uniref:Reduced growth phenotype protein 1 n=1 Tax=Zostera marina TaxID=29655 RepID=A0A0K9NPB7_ZOSMR|nr:hypothetical protein ZOSMA_80G00240 [Zostera marina]
MVSVLSTKTMSSRFSQGFSFFGRSFLRDSDKVETSRDHAIVPCLKVHTDREVYRPGDLINLNITISIPEPSTSKGDHPDASSSFLIDSLSFEIKGIEKLDSQWFIIQKPQIDSKLKKGEQLFLDCTVSSLVSNVIVSPGCLKTYLLRAELPKNLPPSYRGTTIRYIYYVKSILCGRWLTLETEHHNEAPLNNPIHVEARIPLNIWITQKGNTLQNEDGQIDELSPYSILRIDAYWREKNTDSEWVKANDSSEGLEYDYDSLRDETSSISSYVPSKSFDNNFRNSSTLRSSTSRHSLIEAQYSHGDPLNSLSHPLLFSQLSVAEVMDESTGGVPSPQKNLGSYSSVLSPSQKRTSLNSQFISDESGGSSMPGALESATSEGFIRGRSYNIKIDDQVLLRFSPKNSDLSYYFGDMIGGTLTIFHDEGERRCLEVAVTLEISETISHQFIHTSRRSSPKITKIQSDYNEVVADLAQTSFLFSIPMDGPMSFSTHYVSLQWALRFEFFTTPKNVDWARYDHPLLVEGRERGDWVLPITVSAPPPRNQSAQSKSEKPVSLGN